LRDIEAPTFSDIQLTHGGKVVSPTRRTPLTPENFLVLISVRGRVDPRAIVRLEELGKLKKFTSSGTRNGELPACSIVPQLTTLPRAPDVVSTYDKANTSFFYNFKIHYPLIPGLENREYGRGDLLR
jgi:hypothetical protein